LVASVRLRTGAHAVQADEVRESALAIIRDKLALASGDRPLLVLLAGGTNVGKSTICNLLVGETVSVVSALARGTKSPVVCGARATLERMETLLPGAATVRAEGAAGSATYRYPTVVFAPSDSLPDGCLLIDSPDLDSDYAPNRAWADRLLHAADALVLVTTPEKYHDAAVGSFLRQASGLGRALAAVMNKSDSREALEDFVQAVWTPVAGKAPVLALPRRADMRDEAAPLSVVIEGWCANRVAVKASALDGSVHALRMHLERLAELVDEEHRWLDDLHQGMASAADEAVRAYRRQVRTERFEELDRVFRRLMREFRIPVVDDFYDGVRSLGTAVVGRARHRLGDSDDQGRAAMLERERRRVTGVCRGLLVDLARRLEGVPLPIRDSSLRWRASMPECADLPRIDAFLAAAERDVERWVAEESETVARALGARPGVRRLLIGVKSCLQIGAGVLGGILTGGLNVSDLAVVPAVERLMAFLLERGLGHPYFLRCRSRLLDVREASLRGFLDELMVPLRQAVPLPEPGLAERIRDVGAQLPGARELLQ
jgi:hypothetical protein